MEEFLDSDNLVEVCAAVHIKRVVASVLAKHNPDFYVAFEDDDEDDEIDPFLDEADLIVRALAARGFLNKDKIIQSSETEF